ncbi:TBC1 domain family member 13-like [Solanum pennellii]|uniref:TBC1 domain family member 13-like n=1 Tax=Solanum pennellii TaxID=28526 RepID=A0ABM1FYZ3_SOLPN|nr:TBC1 domain family member 13-like [Solanum pennellii]
MMPKISKLNVPEKPRKLVVFPQKIGSLVINGFHHGREESNYEEMESGEELQTFDLTREFALKQMIKDQCYDFDDELISFPQNKNRKSESIVLHACNDDDKRSDLEYEISRKEINLEKLQRVASSGIPDGGSLRATIWKLLLGYLPTSRDLWEKELNESRLKYDKLKEEFLRKPSELSCRKDKSMILLGHDTSSGVIEPLKRYNISKEDHPLSLGKTSIWHQYFEFTEISEQIDRDLQRTHPDLEFFSGDSSLSTKNKESMRNVLLLFAKLNPAISYVQGMNEVLAPLYYVFNTDNDERNVANIEADTFSCFVILMSSCVDHFCQQFDCGSFGVHSTLSKLSELLKTNDEELWHHLEFKTKVNPQFYAFRWITLLLTQEFSLHHIVRIWDTLLSNPFGLQEMLLRICCAMLMCVKSKLIRGDFVGNLKLLQHFPEVDVEHLLQVAQGINMDTSFHSTIFR